MQAVFWGVLFVVMVVIEAPTMGLTTIWFAAGALVSVFLAVAGAPLWLQIIAFFVVSLVLLYFTRPIAIKYFNKGRQKTNAESLIGEIGLVKETVDNRSGQGMVVINGMEWTARTVEGIPAIGAGWQVKVVRIEGVKLIVEPVGIAPHGEESYMPNDRNT